jgi:hypothetical protein
MTLVVIPMLIAIRLLVDGNVSVVRDVFLAAMICVIAEEKMTPERLKHIRAGLQTKCGCGSCQEGRELLAEIDRLTVRGEAMLETLDDIANLVGVSTSERNGEVLIARIKQLVEENNRGH